MTSQTAHGTHKVASARRTTTAASRSLVSRWFPWSRLVWVCDGGGWPGTGVTLREEDDPRKGWKSEEESETPEMKIS